MSNPHFRLRAEIDFLLNSCVSNCIHRPDIHQIFETFFETSKDLMMQFVHLLDIFAVNPHTTLFEYVSYKKQSCSRLFLHAKMVVSWKITAKSGIYFFGKVHVLRLLAWLTVFRTTSLWLVLYLQLLCFLGEVLFNESANNSTTIQCKSWVYKGVERSAVTEVRFEWTLLLTINARLLMKIILPGRCFQHMC